MISASQAIKAITARASSPTLSSPTLQTGKADGGGKSIYDFVHKKHTSYLRLSQWCAGAYYATRVVAGLSSALLPFVVASYHQLATVLAIAVAVTVALDSIFKPRDKWQLYSKATDLLAAEEAKLTGESDKYKDLLGIVMATEAAKLDRLVDLKDLLKEAKNAAAAKDVTSGQ